MATGRKTSAGKKAAGTKAAGKKAAARKAGLPKPAKGPAKKAAPPASQATPKQSRFLNIDYSRCRGCGGCADAFPRLFEMRGDLAWVINAETFDPRRDGGALTVCPYYAIILE
jgi:ferredoxin